MSGVRTWDARGREERAHAGDDVRRAFGDICPVAPCRLASHKSAEDHFRCERDAEALVKRIVSGGQNRPLPTGVPPGPIELVRPDRRLFLRIPRGPAWDVVLGSSVVLVPSGALVFLCELVGSWIFRADDNVFSRTLGGFFVVLASVLALAVAGWASVYLLGFFGVVGEIVRGKLEGTTGGSDRSEKSQKMSASDAGWMG